MWYEFHLNRKNFKQNKNYKPWNKSLWHLQGLIAHALGTGLECYLRFLWLVLSFPFLVRGASTWGWPSTLPAEMSRSEFFVEWNLISGRQETEWHQADKLSFPSSSMDHTECSCSLESSLCGLLWSGEQHSNIGSHCFIFSSFILTYVYFSLLFFLFPLPSLFWVCSSHSCCYILSIYNR